MTEKVQVRIFPDGRIVAETIGIKGEKCTDLIPLLESLLHAESVEAEYTSEYYEVEQVSNEQIHEHNGNNETKPHQQ